MMKHRGGVLRSKRSPGPFWDYRKYKKRKAEEAKTKADPLWKVKRGMKYLTTRKRPKRM